MVRPKKFLGQHFLRDKNIAARIVEALQVPEQSIVLEIGPGTGILTELLMKQPIDLWLNELDRESVAFLRKTYPAFSDRIVEGDFLELDFASRFGKPFSIIGNFPYNISSQIFFKVLDAHGQVRQVVCMLQKEVAERLASPPGSKAYGILSVLLQAYYEIDFLFKVSPGVFHPPPKVNSAVIRLRRNGLDRLACDEKLFRKVVKQSFQTRRKTLRNALKNLNLDASLYNLSIMDKRAEQLTVEDFVSLTLKIEQSSERSSTI